MQSNEINTWLKSSFFIFNESVLLLILNLEQKQGLELCCFTYYDENEMNHVNTVM